MLQQNVNPYNEDSFRMQFMQTELYQKIANEIEIMVWNKSFTGWLQKPSKDITLRRKYFARIASMSAFYYLQFLLEKNPKQILDLGCGDNWFKRYIPQIWGIDGLPRKSKWFMADESSLINDYWLQTRKNSIESLMTINAMHFLPIENVRERVINLISSVKFGGRGYIALNVSRLVEESNIEEFKYLIGKNFTNKTSNNSSEYFECVKKVDEYLRIQLFDLPANVLVFDLDLTYMEEGLDGNLKIVFERSQSL